MVLPIARVKTLTRLEPHESLADELVEYDESMGKCLFLSHTWLGHQEPDPNNAKFELLRHLAERILSGKLDIGPHWTTESAFGALQITGKDLAKDLANGFIWLDWWSIPQATDALQNRLLAISSITSYVADSHFFMVLAGAWTHRNGSVRDVRAWGSRGWCRVEQLANALSPRIKPLIVALSPSAISTYGPGGIFGRPWLYEPVGCGAFTVDADKESLGTPLATLIDARRALALSDSDLLWFRVLSACKAHLLSGLPIADQIQPEPLDEWMKSLRFQSVDDGKASGLTPLRFAILAGRRDLVRSLLERNADVEAPLSASVAPFEFLKGQSMLQTACAIRDDPELIGLLLQHRADPRTSRTDPKLYPLHFAVMYGHRGNVDALMAHQKTSSMCDLQSMCGSCPLRGDVPFAFATYFGRHSMFSHLLQKYPEQMGALLKKSNAAGLNLITNNLLAIGDCDTLRAAIDSAPMMVNEVAHTARAAKSWLYFVFGPAKIARLFWTTARYGAGLECWAHATRCSALHAASYLGNLGAVSLLIDKKADVLSTKHPRRAHPLHCAALGGHVEIIRSLAAAGAVLKATDRRGKTAESWASRAKQTQCIGILRELEQLHD